MVYSAFLWEKDFAKENAKLLKSLGVKDSKKMSKMDRNKCFEYFKDL